MPGGVGVLTLNQEIVTWYWIGDYQQRAKQIRRAFRTRAGPPIITGDRARSVAYRAS